MWTLCRLCGPEACSDGFEKGVQEVAAEAKEQRDLCDPGVRELAGCWTRIASCDPDAYRQWARVWSGLQNWPDRIDLAGVSGFSTTKVLWEVGDQEMVVD